MRFAVAVTVPVLVSTRAGAPRATHVSGLGSRTASTVSALRVDGTSSLGYEPKVRSSAKHAAKTLKWVLGHEPAGLVSMMYHCGGVQVAVSR